MKRRFGIALAAAAALTLTIVLNVTMLAGFPWSERILGS
jgi:hypothetical protein